MTQSNNELLENVKTWLNIDNEIRALQKEIRNRRKLKKDLTEGLVGIMKNHDIEQVNIPDGQLIYTKHSTDDGLISSYGKNINEAVKNRDQIALNSLEYMFNKVSKMKF